MDIYQILVTHNREWTAREFLFFVIVFIVVAFCLRQLVKRDKMKGFQAYACLAALTFLAIVYASTVFTRNPQTDYHYNLDLFWSWRAVFRGSREMLKEDILNIVLFVPLGGLLPFVFEYKMRWWQGLFKDISLKYNLFTIKTNIVMSILGSAVEFTAFGYCLFRLWTHDITYGTMTLFLQQRSNLSGAFGNVISIIPSFLNSSVSAHRIRELVELPKEVHIPDSAKLDPLAKDGFRVQMHGVEFSYIEGNEVITRSEFQAAPGEIVALVGPSGEGKTTMIRLILGLIRPQEGETVIIASNGKTVPMNAETRHLFAYVPQGNTILSGTIAENMRMVKEDATDEEIIEALKISCAWDFVQHLPDTINSRVGERGRGFSEGQSQRLAIARAVLRDAPVLLLDEATSALDVTTERNVLRNIIRQRPNKTCIVTTHRPSVLGLCQRVYRVMNGTVTELDGAEGAKMVEDF